MAISKVVYGGRVLMDLTADTVQADKLLKGVTAHGADGEPVSGTCEFDSDTQDATAAAAEILSGMVGQRQTVLVESVSARDAGWVGGKTPRALMVNFPGDETLIGKFVEVEITSAGKNTLRGRMI